MNNQTEALRLAQEINILFVSQWGLHSPMAKDSKIVFEELHRLHELNQELLEALKSTRAFVNSVAPHGGLFERINAAIAKAEGGP